MKRVEVKKILLLSVVLSFFPGSSAMSATLMEYYATPSFDDERGDLDIYIADKRVLFAGKAQSGDLFRIIYDDENKRFTVLNGGEQSYRHYYLKTFNSIHQVRAQYQDDLEDKLAETDSEEKRDAYKELSEVLEERNLGGQPGEAPEYVPADRVKTISDRQCTVYEVSDQEGGVDRILCATELSAAGLSEQDVKLLESMADAALRIVTAVEWAGYGLPRIALDYQQGVPAEIEYLKADDGGLKLTLTKVSELETDEELFSIPEGYSEVPVRVESH